LTAAAILLGIVIPASAQDLSGHDVDAILAIAQEYGKATLTESGNGDPQITGRMNGLLYHVFFANCTDGEECEDLNFYLGFLDLKPSLEVINEWNQTKRFARAYLDTDLDACIEMDLDLVVPVSAEYMRSQFDLWGLVVTQFSEHVGY
jgi:hypothetical protein